MTMNPPPQPPLINHIPPNPRSKRRLSDPSSEIPSFLSSSIPVFTPAAQRLATTRTGSDWDYYIAYLRSRLHLLKIRLSTLRPKDFLDIWLLLVVIWFIVLYWGERSVFNSAIWKCDWRCWENWPQGAQPHHVALVADPQLVDPHTYPGRPWPLSAATVYYTDLYLRRGFGGIVNGLDPQTVFFLGDLFDGGREWNPDRAEVDEVVEKRWRRYGDRMWFREYKRFGRIFVDTWLKGAKRRNSNDNGRKIVMGLPGNHDLGIGNGIRLPVRKRFEAYFGSSNRIDLVGNHTFVSVDTVSLSAKGQLDGNAVSKDAGNQIWEPTEVFLHEAQAIKSRVIRRQLRDWEGAEDKELLDHSVLDFPDSKSHTIHPEKGVDADVPSILLSHVPFYRNKGSPCGPHREHYPPSNPDAPEQEDERNAIHMGYGNQYQNTLLPAISNEIVDLVGGITHIFSGDDHDYCEVMHREYTAKGGGIREITVKSLSWAMGIRKPGFVLLSLWNPLDGQGKAISPQKSTIQTHLCLLPDQLGIFIRYAWLLIFTLLSLTVSAFLACSKSKSEGRPGVLNGSILPTSRVPRPSAELHTPLSAHSSTSDHGTVNGLSARTKSKNPGGVNGYGYTPPTPPPEAEANLGKVWQDIDLSSSGNSRPRSGIYAVTREMKERLLAVAMPVMVWYFWLLWTG